MASLPISAAALRQRLREGQVSFYFVKKDGTLREVLGTTDLARIPASGQPAGGRPSPDSVVTFWDILNEGWRSAKVETQFFVKP